MSRNEIVGRAGIGTTSPQRLWRGGRGRVWTEDVWTEEVRTEGVWSESVPVECDQVSAQLCRGDVEEEGVGGFGLKELD